MTEAYTIDGTKYTNCTKKAVSYRSKNEHKSLSSLTETVFVFFDGLNYSPLEQMEVINKKEIINPNFSWVFKLLGYFLFWFIPRFRPLDIWISVLIFYARFYFISISTDFRETKVITKNAFEIRIRWLTLSLYWTFNIISRLSAQISFLNIMVQFWKKIRPTKTLS